MPRRPLALLAVAASVGAAVLLLDPAPAYSAEGGLKIIPDGISGMNPLRWRPWRLLSLIAMFVVLVPVLNALLFRPLLAVLDEREQRTAGARARATELAQQAGALVARHDDAIRRAREVAHAEQTRVVEEARTQHASTVGTARTAAESKIHDARLEIERATESVRASLAAEAEPIAREIAARLLGRSLS
jgi:F-type H+-transporting ATPase subunit b